MFDSKIQITTLTKELIIKRIKENKMALKNYLVEIDNNGSNYNDNSSDCDDDSSDRDDNSDDYDENGQYYTLEKKVNESLPGKTIISSSDLVISQPEIYDQLLPKLLPAMQKMCLTRYNVEKLRERIVIRCKK